MPWTFSLIRLGTTGLGEMTMTWLTLSLTLCLVGALALCALLARQMQVMNERWMRMFCEKQGMSPAIMASDIATEPAPELKQPDVRRRVSVPLPGATLWRKSGAMK